MKKEKKQEKEYTMQDAFIDEVDEDLKNESFKKMWEKYGTLITICVVLVLTAAVSYESLKAWYIRRAENWAEAYTVALSLQNRGRYDESMEALNSIIGNKFGAYADLAKMQQVNVLLDSKKEEEALKMLEEIIADDGFNKQLRDLATVKLASYKQDSASVEDMQTLLQPILSNTQNAWYAIARDMIALVFVRDGKIDDAKEIYSELLDSKDVSEEFKNRVKNILSVLQEE